MDTSTATKDGQFMGAEITFGPTLIGQVDGLARDPISQRVRRLITSYGPGKRRVGVPIEWVVQHVSHEKRANWGFDVMSESYVDLVKAGIIDPAKVTRSALENAASVAGMILSTEALVTDWADGQAVAAASSRGGMYE